MGKTAVLAVKIVGDARSAIGALDDTASKMDKVAAGAAAAGAAAGLALASGFMDAVNVEAANDKLAGQLALATDEAARIGGVAAELFANGWGTGADQINDALNQVIGNIDGMRDASDESLTQVTEQVLTLANTFDQDLGGTTTAIGQMIRTGMAPDAQSALDMITASLQGNARASTDLMDTLTEYPALFQRLGLDGQTALGLIDQGLAAGARSTDLVADALKEFQIRATDGSKLSAEGFQALGLDAAAMTAQIAAGGEGASAGLDTVLDKLREMTDPVAQNAAAVALFGTQAEDLGGALYALDPSAATAALGEVAGAAGALGDTVQDNAATRLEQFARQVQLSFQEMGAAALPYVQPILDALGQFAPILGPAAVVIAAVAGAVLVISAAMRVYAAVQAVQTAIQWAQNAAWLANPITWIVLAIIVAIGLLVAAIVWVVQNWDGILAAGAAAVDGLVAAWNGFVVWWNELWAGIGAWVAGIWDQYVWQPALLVATWIITTYVEMKATWDAMWAAIGAFVAGIWDQYVLQPALRVAMWIIRTYVEMKATWDAMWAALGQLVQQILDQYVLTPARQVERVLAVDVPAAVEQVKGFFRGLGDSIANAFSSAVSWIQSALDWLRQLAGQIMPGWMQSALGLQFSAEVAVVGRMQRLAGLDTIPRMLTLDAAPAGLTFAAAPGPAGGWGSLSSADLAPRVTQISVTVNGAVDPTSTARQIDGILRRYDAVGGR